MQRRFTGSIAVLAAVLAFSPVMFAQTSKPSATAKAASPKQDLSGVWVAQGKQGSALLTSSKKEPPMTSWGKAQFMAARSENQNATTKDAASNDPRLKCDPAGVPRVYLSNRPIEFIQTPNRLFVFYEEDHNWRQIWTDGRAVPTDSDPTYMGYSVGRWEGDTLVVDTVGSNDKTWLDNVGHPHSDALHVVERIRRVDHGTLQITFTVEDPKAYAKPWTTPSRTFKLKASYDLTEEFCVPDDKAASHSAAAMPSGPDK
jgi:hypothetical protein